jgi:hypothetical protein
MTGIPDAPAASAQSKDGQSAEGQTAPSPFTARQVAILRAMMAIMAITFIGGFALIGYAIFVRAGRVPPPPAVPDAATVQALASQPGVAWSAGRLPAGARLVSSHVTSYATGAALVLVYEDAGGTTLARFDVSTWKLTGLARLGP